MMTIEFVSKTEIKLGMSRQQLIDINAILTVVAAGHKLAPIDQRRAMELERAIRDTCRA